MSGTKTSTDFVKEAIKSCEILYQPQTSTSMDVDSSQNETLPAYFESLLRSKSFKSSIRSTAETIVKICHALARYTNELEELGKIDASKPDTYTKHLTSLLKKFFADIFKESIEQASDEAAKAGHQFIDSQKSAKIAAITDRIALLEPKIKKEFNTYMAKYEYTTELTELEGLSHDKWKAKLSHEIVQGIKAVHFEFTARQSSNEQAKEAKRENFRQLQEEEAKKKANATVEDLYDQITTLTTELKRLKLQQNKSKNGKGVGKDLPTPNHQKGHSKQDTKSKDTKSKNTNQAQTNLQSKRSRPPPTTERSRSRTRSAKRLK